MIAHINIGSNIGDSRSAIERAVAAVYQLNQPINPISPVSPISTISTISTISPIGLFPRRSSIVESEPWGFDSPNKFLNIGVEILTDLSPLELLERLQAIERSISPLSHRNPDGSYRDRLIDLDLIFLLPATKYGGEASRLPQYPAAESLLQSSLPFSHLRLTLPHPHASEREFVMAPIRELWSIPNS